MGILASLSVESQDFPAGEHLRSLSGFVREGSGREAEASVLMRHRSLGFWLSVLCDDASSLEEDSMILLAYHIAHIC